MFSVYAIKSTLSQRIYIGQTNDLRKRLLMHNSGYVKSTEEGRPWELIAFQEFHTREDARWQEFILKKSHDRRIRWLKEHS